MPLRCGATGRRAQRAERAGRRPPRPPVVKPNDFRHERGSRFSQVADRRVPIASPPRAQRSALSAQRSTTVAPCGHRRCSALAAVRCAAPLRAYRSPLSPRPRLRRRRRPGPGTRGPIPVACRPSPGPRIQTSHVGRVDGAAGVASAENPGDGDRVTGDGIGRRAAHGSRWLDLPLSPPLTLPTAADAGAVNCRCRRESGGRVTGDGRRAPGRRCRSRIAAAAPANCR